MIEWVSLGGAARANACAGALTLVALHLTLLGPDRPAPALVALSLLAALLGLPARFTAAPGTAVLCWLFLNGFAIPPAGTLTWAGQRDTLWFTCLLTATLLGTATARVHHARAAYRRVTVDIALTEQDDEHRGH